MDGWLFYRMKVSNADTKNNPKTNVPVTLSTDNQNSVLFLSSSLEFLNQSFLTCWSKYRCVKAPEVKNDKLMANGGKISLVLSFPQILWSLAKRPNEKTTVSHGVYVFIRLLSTRTRKNRFTVKKSCFWNLSVIELICIFPSTWTDFKWEKNQLLFCTLMGG